MRSIGSQFEIEGELTTWEPLGNGHIHDTYLASYQNRRLARRFVHQRINTRVFQNPEALMENLARVTEHLRKAAVAENVADRDRCCLQLVPSRAGGWFWVDSEGAYWRTFYCIEDAETRDHLKEPSEAREAARAFGAFVRRLADLPEPRLADTIPDFHNLGLRVANLQRAVEEDPLGRTRDVAREISAATAWTDRLEASLRRADFASLPRRVVHNDCKLNNVLLDLRTHESLCVIDLDTVMEGTIVSDFGELVRTATSVAGEDEVRPGAVTFELHLFAALTTGFLEGVGPLLEGAELHCLSLAGPTLALENGVRFLEDHLRGDVYFRIHRPDQNLDRCRSQLRRVELMLEALEDCRRIVEDASQQAS